MRSSENTNHNASMPRAKALSNNKASFDYEEVAVSLCSLAAVADDDDCMCLIYDLAS